jgi:subtilisin family serine protease
MSKYSFKATAVATAVTGALMAVSASAATELVTSPALKQAFETSQKSKLEQIKEVRSDAYLVVLKQTTAADLIEQGNYTVDAARATYAAIEQAQADLSNELMQLDATAKIYGSTKLLAPALIVAASDATLSAIKLNSNVARVLPLRDFELHVADVNDYINAAPVNESGNTAAGQKVAVLDTGIDYTHKVFGGEGTVEAYEAAQADPASVSWPQGQVVGGFDYMRNDADPIENDQDFPGSDEGYTSHGTSVSHSVTGIAPDVELLVYSVCGGGCPFAAQVNALEAAMDPNGDGDLSDRADVINMSLGGEFGDTYTEDGTQYLIQRAVRLGTNMVISAGNDGDHPFRIGGPSTTPNALSVGAMTHPTLEQANPTAMMAGVDVVVQPASFGPQGAFEGSMVLGEIVYPGDVAETEDVNEAEGCDGVDADNNPTNPYAGMDFTGKTVLIDRGSCAFTEKVLNAQEQGAEHVLIANNNDDGTPAPMGGFDAAVTIRSFGLTFADGAAIKEAITAGSTDTLDINIEMVNVAGAVAGFSSRGPSMDGLLKPEITAPGTSIMVAATGTQDQLAPATGTSFSGPITAGAVALVREARPELSAHEVKAILMNTADLNVTVDPVSLNPDSPLAPISLIGAGLVDVEKAIASPTVAMVHHPEFDTKQAALSFGFDVLDEVTSYTKTVEVNNHSDEDRMYELSMNARYANDAETGALSWDFPSELKVPAGESVEFEVTVTIDPARLPMWMLENPQSADDLVPRADALTMAEFDGALVFNDLFAPGENNLQLVYHVLPKAFVGGDLDMVEMDGEKFVKVTNTGYEPLNLSAEMLIGSNDRTDAPFNVKAASANLYGADWCESGIMLTATMQLAGELTHLRQAGYEFMFDADNDGVYDFGIGNYNDVGRSAAVPGRSRTAGGAVVDGATQWAIITGGAFHTTGGDSVTLSACTEDLGLGEMAFGDMFTVKAATGYASYTLGIWAETDSLTGTIPFGINPARFVNESGEEVRELGMGESAYIDASWPVSVNNGLNQIVAVADADMMDEVIESRNNHAPMIEERQTFYTDENVELGTVIGMLAHSDEDGDIVDIMVSGTNLVDVNANGEIVVTGEIDYEYDRDFRFTATAVDAKGNYSDPVEVEIRVNNVKGGDDNDDAFSGSLAWLALLAAPFAALRRRKQK